MMLSAPTRQILIIEDDPDLAGLARLHLEDEGYRVGVEHDGARGAARALAEVPDLLLLDLSLPGKAGLDICREVRAAHPALPVVILTARGSEVDRVLGLELGADDYLTKPVSFRELVARVKGIFRRMDLTERGADGARPARAEVLRRGALIIDHGRRRVVLDDSEVELTSKEFDLLAHLAAHPGRVYTREQLVDNVWGLGYAGYEHTVNSHINRLRKKINIGGPRQRFIETVWGVGYRFSEEV